MHAYRSTYKRAILYQKGLNAFAKKHRPRPKHFAKLISQFLHTKERYKLMFHLVVENQNLNYM